MFKGGKKMKIKNETIRVLTSLEATRMQRERFNTHQCGHGLHKTSKKDRRKADSKKAVRDAKIK